MNTGQSTAPLNQERTRAHHWLMITGLIYLLLVAVGMIGTGFKWSTGGHAKELFDFATNPFVGLMIGTVATALIQSSSTVTSIIVGLVAGGLPVEAAIPMIMGANIGTTITNTIVSLGHVRRADEFRRAFAAATVHDFFNLMAVIIFLPLEMMFGLLQKLSLFLAELLIGGESMSLKSFNFIKPLVKPVTGATKDLFSALPEPFGGVAMIALGIGLIIFSVAFVGKLLKKAMVGRAKEMLHGAIGRGPLTGITSGTVVTVLVQSSSTTTSLIVPLVGTGVLKLKDIYPFTLGANIGTCITALLAATAVSGELAIFALQIALVHLCYNLLAVSLIFGLPLLRNLPLKMAEKLAELATRRKRIAFSYVSTVFFLIPGSLIFLSR
ncbi:Na/Pi symporter [Marinobacterium arenosum]|uniref:Na/Pi symporter n=1 Tax=Marinobacterium arenosum TaxID=2862496 RepID=UPI001C97D173|nr:Na/Pi symporter [Marinobacterium arenosum]MBY4676196.1 Na/Pi symporter [Marinobacterium arenosum]